MGARRLTSIFFFSTCVRFRILANADFLWQCVDISSRPISTKSLWKLIHRRSSASWKSLHVRILNDSISDTVWFIYLAMLQKQCPDLITLELIDTRILRKKIFAYPFPASLRTLVLRNFKIEYNLFYRYDRPIHLRLVRLIETSLTADDMFYLYRHNIRVLKM